MNYYRIVSIFLLFFALIVLSQYLEEKRIVEGYKADGSYECRVSCAEMNSAYNTGSMNNKTCVCRNRTGNSVPIISYVLTEDALLLQ